MASEGTVMMTVSAADMMMDAAMSFLAASLSRAPTLLASMMENPFVSPWMKQRMK